MADELAERGSPDRHRINVNEDYELGDGADAVRQHLNK